MILKGRAALEQWAKTSCSTYPDVEIKDMTESWRDGLAFCALMHHHRPKIIDLKQCKRGDVLKNCDLAFTVAENILGVPALLEPEDMLRLKQLDSRSILTYLAELYHALMTTKDNNKENGLETDNYTTDIERDSLYSSASSRTSSPGTLSQVTENKVDEKGDKGDFIDSNASQLSDLEMEVVAFESQEKLENDMNKSETEIMPIVTKRTKRSLASLVNRRLVKSMYELENAQETESAFTVGFRKFSDLTKSSMNIQSDASPVESNTFKCFNKRQVSVTTQTDKNVTNIKHHVTVQKKLQSSHTQTENSHTFNKICHSSRNSCQVINNDGQFSSLSMSFHAPYFPRRYQYETTEAIIDQYNSMKNLQKKKEIIGLQLRRPCQGPHSGYSQYNTLV